MNFLEKNGYNAYLANAEDTLKPCPFCGGKANYTSGIHMGYSEEFGEVSCDDCGARVRVMLYGYGMFDPLRAFDKWNGRVGDDS